MIYNLVMKIGNNNYQSFDFNLLSEYNGENLNTLEGIDTFTSKFSSEEELKMSLLEANFINAEDFSKEMKIIFYENGKMREEKYGICYQKLLASHEIITFIITNINNPQTLNKIYNEFAHRKNTSTFLNIVLNILKNIKEATNLKDIYYLNFISYLEKRDLGLFINKQFSAIIKEDKNMQVGDESGFQRKKTTEK